jgi:hypothetical protein
MGSVPQPLAIARACLAIDPDKLEIAASDKPAVEVLRRFISGSISEYSIKSVFLRQAIAERAQLTDDWPPSEAARRLAGKLLWKEFAQGPYLDVTAFKPGLKGGFEGGFVVEPIPEADLPHCDVNVEVRLDDPLKVCGPVRYCVFRCDAQQCVRDPRYDHR